MIRKAMVLLTLAVLCALTGGGCATSKPAKAPLDAGANGVGNGQPVAKPDGYQVGVGDVLDVSVYNHQELSQKLRVSPSGTVSYPLLGVLKVEGVTLSAVGDMIRAGLAKGYVPDPQVSVNVDAVAGQKIYVLGEVRNPQVLRVKEEIDLVEAITTAGGFTRDANMSAILLIRRNGDGQSTMDALDVKSFLKKSDLAQNPTLQRGDVVYVPPSRIANVDRFFIHLQTILSPLMGNLMSGILISPNVRNVLLHGRQESGVGVNVGG
ncbi:MAG: polysaccharide biosynthesis/export family protein [bacterium]